jgi:4-hydroxy-tetrahydrodipicolinate synthase
MAFSGVHTALITPFHADGSLDLPCFEVLCQRQLEARIHGLVPCGTTGEAPTLTEHEWAKCITAAVQASDGRVPVTAGVGTNNTTTTLHRLKRAKALGADAGLLVFPYYNKPSAHGLTEHVRQAAAVGLPLVLYHVPGRTAQRVSSELLGQLANMDGVVAVKEATGDVHFGIDVMSRTQTPVLSGDDFTFFALQCMGGAGVISVISNVLPAETVALYEATASGNLKKAQRILSKLWELIGFLFSDSNPVPCKVAMHRQGLCEPTVRLPLAPMQGQLPERLDRLLTQLALS